MLGIALAAAPVAGFVVPQAMTTAAVASEHTVDHVRLNGFEARLAYDINGARRANGMRALVVVPGTTDVARRWSWRLAGGQRLWHNPALVRDIERAGSSAWTMVSENV